VRARIALELGVHPSTIGRDIQRIFGDRGPRQGMSAS
jgi:IS30 family transposase